jgi:hypothetical protein
MMWIIFKYSFLILKWMRGVGANKSSFAVVCEDVVGASREGKERTWG